MTAAMATMAIKLSGATETSNGVGNETGSDAQEGAVRATEVSATIKAFRCMSLLHSVKRIYRLKRLGDVPNHDVGSHPKSRGGMPATKGLVFIISKILVCFYLAQRNKIATSRDSQPSRVGANQRTKDWLLFGRFGFQRGRIVFPYPDRFGGGAHQSRRSRLTPSKRSSGQKTELPESA